MLQTELELIGENNFCLIASEDSYYLCKRWKDKKFKNILDLGCDIKSHSVFFAKNGFQVSAVNWSDYIINDLKLYAAEKNLNITFKSFEINKIPFNDETFDCIIAYNSIYHTDKDGFTSILSEIHRILKKGGEAYITLLSKNTWKYKEDFISTKVGRNILLNNENQKNDPSFYVDIYDIRKYFNKYEFLKAPIEITEYDIDNPGYYSTHFKLLVKKREN